MLDDNPAAATMRRMKLQHHWGHEGRSEDENDEQYWMIKIELSGCNDDDGKDGRR